MAEKKAIDDIVQFKKQNRLYICDRQKCGIFCKEDCFMTRDREHAIEKEGGKWIKVTGHQCRGKVDRELQHIPIGTDIQQALPQGRIDAAMRRIFERSTKR